MSEQNDKLQGERELLPCPFCGGQAETDSRRAYRNIATGKMGDGVAVYCLKCSVESLFCCEDMPEYSRDELLGILVENWNRRAALASDAKPITVGQILALERRCDMTDDETIRFARSVEALVLRSTAQVELVAKP